MATFCLDESVGGLIWKTQGRVSRVPLAIAYNRVFLSSEDGYLYAFSAETGETLWSHYVGFASYATSASPPAVADGKVFVSTSGSVIGLNATTGERKWTYTISGANPPTVADGYIIFSVVGGAIQKFLYTFDAGTWEGTHYYVNVVSNSSISNFRFNPSSGPLIRFEVTGPNGTPGYCNVTIPKGLLYTQTTWNVSVDGNPVNPTVSEDSFNSHLHFIYSHTTRTVEIRGTNAIPEFPSIMVLPLFIVLTLFATVSAKKRFLRNLKL
jgi:hypothetical protein